MTNGGNGRGERLQIVLQRMSWRSWMISASNYACAAAIRELLKRGLSAEGFEWAAFGSKSEELGVIGNTPGGRGK